MLWPVSAASIAPAQHLHTVDLRRLSHCNQGSHGQGAQLLSASASGSQTLWKPQTSR
ncbi:hypothetical protein XAB3213_3630005 [Xanthomonas citri pv. bilvae]|nr:hypothetical protein XAB3213_3630005 [Xanthomonas citri pv. bilvae]